MKDLLASIADDVIAREEADLDFPAAKRVVQRMQVNGELDEESLLEFAKRRQYSAPVVALARLCSSPIDMIKQMLD